MDSAEHNLDLLMHFIDMTFDHQLNSGRLKGKHQLSNSLICIEH